MYDEPGPIIHYRQSHPRIGSEYVGREITFLGLTKEKYVAEFGPKWGVTQEDADHLFELIEKKVDKA